MAAILSRPQCVKMIRDREIASEEMLFIFSITNIDFEIIR